MDDIPRRVIMWVRVTDISGDPQRRHISLGEAFCKQILKRDFHAELHPSCYDHVHIPPDFDSDCPLKSVKQQLTAEDVAQIPHSVYLASCQNGELYVTGSS
ncbi:similar to An18g02620 [Aspergillus luchuensis]|uniref:Similar to An18g02620 n=1 Tax=Aspergillus kawachii TaxID=1069201 RepID=A0A146F0R2_ASPKA|nr:similar to An18g02620 [Aspergillus luchuensis]